MLRAYCPTPFPVQQYSMYTVYRTTISKKINQRFLLGAIFSAWPDSPGSRTTKNKLIRKTEQEYSLERNGS